MSSFSVRLAARCAAFAVAAASLAGCQPDTPSPHSSPRGESPATAIPPQPAISAGAANITADDEALASKIESALTAETSLHGSTIDVKADDGIVTLTGSTPSTDLRSMAAQIALSVEGVKHVRNELAIARET